MSDNTRGLVIEMINTDSTGAVLGLREVVLFPGIILERETTPEVRRKHWRSASFKVSPTADTHPLDVTNERSWLGRWLSQVSRRGYELLGPPYLMEANAAEILEINGGRMPRALAIRLGKVRVERGLAVWPDEKEES